MFGSFSRIVLTFMLMALFVLPSSCAMQQENFEEEEGYVSSIGIPLPEGFLEAEDSRAIFDTPGGRIVEVQAVGQSSPAKITKYYKEVLPELGWKKGSSLVYVREGEELSFRYEVRKNDIIIIFTLKPSES